MGLQRTARELKFTDIKVNKGKIGHEPVQETHKFIIIEEAKQLVLTFMKNFELVKVISFEALEHAITIKHLSFNVGA